ncbi:hypothetical protein DES53_10927 [Roseimicrobium gellanilyticum]|uniref:TIGR01777 family protein n=1 Tax=Roseimicrobium gellanilyticum TaxID=748857 RepID=A0A366HCA2_9BACT|nr:TIGR01777 family oxidoreductase [Roseimicrobium gellanilyticum]RBP39600.1 hypothetical protein DES53_10927 [Roseimicrobium gellanilyticum]
MHKGKVIIAGGSGFLGIALARYLAGEGYEVFILSRHLLPPGVPARYIHWDGRTLGAWAAELEGATAVVNLTGKNVNCRYTTAALDEINDSRVDSVKVIGEAVRACRFPPAVWVQAGSLAIYGDAGDHVCDENAPHGEGIPVDTCLKWEGAFEAENTPHTRKVIYRISFVLGNGGGALRMLANLTKCYLGGAIGSGRQYISWLHVEDMNRLWLRAIEDERMSGVYNATAPEAVTNAGFMRELRSTLHRPWSPPMPAFLVPIGCFFLRTEPVLALTGRRGIPARLTQEGFEFRHAELPEALHDLFAK